VSRFETERALREYMRIQPAGVNLRVRCPVCEELEASAVTYPDGGGTWLCFRASCGARGAWPGSAGAGPLPTAPPPFVPRPVPLWMLDDPGITVTQLRAFDGLTLGHQTRRVVDGKKEVRTWALLPRPMYHAPVPILVHTPDAGALWFVEDARSAERLAAHGRRAVALLGTSLQDKLLEELRFAVWRHAVTTMFVALDPGAEEAAAKVEARLNEKFLALRTCVVYLDTDIKDQALVDWDALLRYYTAS
jgi:hypothetical protein